MKKEVIGEEVEVMDVVELDNDEESFTGFEQGDIIVSDDFSVIGVFEEECISVDELDDYGEPRAWPKFFIAFNNGKLVEEFDDMSCQNWPRDYRYATDDELEVFLQEVEDITGLVWDTETNSYSEKDEDNWMENGKIYPRTWEEAEQECQTACELTDSVLISDQDKIAEALLSYGKLIILRDIYMENCELKKGEIVYAVVKTSDQDQSFTVRPYIYGVRKSPFTFKFQSQARLFLTYFDRLMTKAKNFV